MRALGLELPGAGLAQVSMNLVDLERTGVEEACTAVRDAVEAAGGRVERVELVGLLPAEELARCSAEFVTWAGLGPEVTIEGRLAARGPEALAMEPSTRGQAVAAPRRSSAR